MNKKHRKKAHHPCTFFLMAGFCKHLCNHQRMVSNTERERIPFWTGKLTSTLCLTKNVRATHSSSESSPPSSLSLQEPLFDWGLVHTQRITENNFPQTTVLTEDIFKKLTKRQKKKKTFCIYWLFSMFKLAKHKTDHDNACYIFSAFPKVKPTA